MSRPNGSRRQASPSPPVVSSMPFRSRSYGMRSTIFPVVVSFFGKAGHRFFHVLLCNLALRFAHKVDDPLVCFQVLVPRRSCLPAGRHSHTHERKERHKKPATLLDNKRVAGKFTEPEGELKIRLEQRFAISLICRPSHTIHRGLNLREVGAHLYPQASRQSLRGPSQVIESVATPLD